MPIRIYRFSKNAVATRKSRLIFYYLTFVFLTSVLWISRKFGNPTVEQFIFHIQFGADNLNAFDRELIFSFLKNTFLASTIYSIITISIEELLLHKLTSNKPRINRILKLIIGNRIPLLIFLIAAVISSSRFGIYTYFSTTSTRDFIRDNYIHPQKVQIDRSSNPKNLILIYVESLENSYRREDLFERNLIRHIDQLGGFEFPKFKQLPGTGWTIAGIVSSQCSIPLKPIALVDGNLQGELFKQFLPNATCLGDTLKKLGYINVFLGGASLEFAGKGKYFKTHSYDKVVGRKSWLASTKYTLEDMNDWGLHDDDLFNEALQTLKELHNQDKPFNLTILTVDTHFPKGYISKTCKQQGGKNYVDIVECTSKLVHGFINDARNLGYLKNTNVVILGDHLSMPTTVKEKIAQVQDRQIYNRWISLDSYTLNRKEITHFDISPTILEFLGHKIIGDRYGLGFTAINKSDSKLSNFAFEDLYDGLSRRSNYYNSLWYIDKK